MLVQRRRRWANIKPALVSFCVWCILMLTNLLFILMSMTNNAIFNVNLCKHTECRKCQQYTWYTSYWWHRSTVNLTFSKFDHFSNCQVWKCRSVIHQYSGAINRKKSENAAFYWDIAFTHPPIRYSASQEFCKFRGMPFVTQILGYTQFPIFLYWALFKTGIKHGMF